MACQSVPASVETALLELGKALEPSPGARRRAIAIGDELGASLMRADGRIARTLVGGSIAHGTKVSPIDEIDLLCVFEGVEGTAAAWTALLEGLRRDLAATDGVAAPVVGDAVVSATLADPRLRVDVVPLVLSPDRRRLVLRRRAADGGSSEVGHDPWAQMRIMHAKDRACGGRFRPIVRIFKRWNEQNGRPVPRSYIVQTCAWYALHRESTLVDGLTGAVRCARHALDRAPALPDPGNPQDDVLGGLSRATRDRGVRGLREVELALREFAGGRRAEADGGSR